MIVLSDAAQALAAGLASAMELAKAAKANEPNCVYLYEAMFRKGGGYYTIVIASDEPEARKMVKERQSELIASEPDVYDHKIKKSNLMRVKW
jgi:hypothetical protein